MMEYVHLTGTAGAGTGTTGTPGTPCATTSVDSISFPLFPPGMSSEEIVAFTRNPENRNKIQVMFQFVSNRSIIFFLRFFSR